jgi:hypothetical protein
MNLTINFLRMLMIAVFAFISNGIYAQDIPLPEHPRPDFERELWQNLNGEWDFQFYDGDEEALLNGDFRFANKIMVPFPWGSKLSGVDNEGDIGWYRREVVIDQSWSDKRVFLTIGASDWETSVWIDGEKLGTHQGGYTPFSFELTNFIDTEERHSILIKVDDARRDFTLYGKQGYGDARGIWQTVYLEARGQSFIDAVHFSPDIDNQTVKVDVYLPEELKDAKNFTVEIADDEGNTFQGAGLVNKDDDKGSTSIKIPNPKLWNIETPHLYAAKVNFLDDEINSYFGMRKISVVNLPGTEIPYIAINDEPIYLQLALDQSYHPDGFYTFPSDQFMKEEIIRSKSIGLNGIRPHIKVEIPRKLYWADKLGLLVMQDLPNSWGEPGRKMKNEAETTLRAMIKRDYNHPAIFSWIVFNETWGLFTNTADGERKYLPKTQDWVASMYYLTKSLDQTRLVEDNSVCCGRGHTETDINSFHAYLPGWRWDEVLKDHTEKVFPGCEFLFEDGFKQGNQPFINSECGNVWGYEGSTGDIDWSYDYHRMINTFRIYPKCAGWLYTEHHDVINEWNGYWRFDRSEKYTGMDEIVEGMSLNDLHSKVYISTGNDITFRVIAGSQLQIPLYISSMTSQDFGNQLFLNYEIDFINEIGEEVNLLNESFNIDYHPYINEKIRDLKIDAPANNGLAIIKLFLKDSEGNILHRNFAHIIVEGGQAAKNVYIDALKPNEFENQEWSVKQWGVLDGLKVNGAGSGFFEYQFKLPKFNALDVDEAYIIMEVSAKQLFDKDITGAEVEGLDYMRGAKISPHANPNAYPMTDETRHSSLMKVYLNEEEVDEILLMDDPADHRGVLSWESQPKDRKLYEAGSYGYLIKVKLTPPVLKKLESMKNIIVRIETNNNGGLAVYGADFGRYPFDPSLVIKTK